MIQGGYRRPGRYQGSTWVREGSSSESESDDEQTTDPYRPMENSVSDMKLASRHRGPTSSAIAFVPTYRTGRRLTLKEGIKLSNE